MESNGYVSRPYLPRHHSLAYCDRYSRFLNESKHCIESVVVQSTTQPTTLPVTARLEFRLDSTIYSVRIEVDPIPDVINAASALVYPAGTIPFKFRPAMDSNVIIPLVNNDLPTSGYLTLGSDGSVRIDVSGNWDLAVSIPPSTTVYQIQ